MIRDGDCWVLSNEPKAGWSSRWEPDEVHAELLDGIRDGVELSSYDFLDHRGIVLSGDLSLGEEDGEKVEKFSPYWFFVLPLHPLCSDTYVEQLEIIFSNIFLWICHLIWSD